MSVARLTVPTGEGDLTCLERREGEGPTLLFAHATGFCKEVWLPVIEELALRRRGWTAVAVDQRLHGGSQGFPPEYDWWNVGRDLLTVIASRAGVIGIGHSGGGAAVAMAELMRPGAFAAAVLVEPIVFPPPFGVAETHPLAEGARRRRDRFPSRADVLTSYRGRGPFAGWDERALQGYVAGGFREDAGGVVLRCAPEDEAQFFLHAYAHGLWDRLDDLDLDVALIAGADSGTYAPGYANRLAERLGARTVDVVAGAGHFVPMERPGLVADHIVAMLDRIPPGS